MSYISDDFHRKKLKKYNINIKTKYIVDNSILERNTDYSKNDEIKNGIRCEKNYYINNELKHTEKNFDSRIEYTFITNGEENKDYLCPNCGMKSKLINVIDGCPYCNTYYNIEYTNKDLGGKHHYDMILNNNTYRVVTAIIDLIISMILSFIFIKSTSRTFNNYDIIKIFIYGLILSLILYYLFYIIDAYIILSPIKKYKEKQNKKQLNFWNKTKLNKTTFFNNLNYEIRKYYYNIENIIDYDVIDYIKFEEYTKDDKLCVKVTAKVRIVYYENNKIFSKVLNDIYIMKKINDDPLKLNGGVNVIKCHNCGASIDVTKGKCEFCDSKIKYYQEWILENN